MPALLTQLVRFCFFIFSRLLAYRRAYGQSIERVAMEKLETDDPISLPLEF